jgi:hypothetical protein
MKGTGMKLTKILGLIVASFLLFTPYASADIYNFTPTPSNLDDLDHFYYYEWGFNWTVPSGQTITGASLFFNDIRNWDSNPNILYVEMMNQAPLGVTSGFDNEGGGNAFAGQGTHIVDLVNLTTTATDINYNFTSGQIDALKQYLADGNNVAFGFDPDCHFWNNGITFKVATAAAVVPEPATMMMMGSGLIGMLGFRRRKV